MFHCFLALDGEVDVAKLFVPNQSFDTVFLREPFDFAGAMLVHSRDQVAGDANVQRSMFLAGQDVHTICPLFHFACSRLIGREHKQNPSQSYTKTVILALRREDPWCSVRHV